jgi:hypothetical protein
MVMAIQTVEAWNHGVHRNFADVIVFLVIGVVLLVFLPAKRKGSRARVLTPYSHLARRNYEMGFAQQCGVVGSAYVNCPHP